MLPNSRTTLPNSRTSLSPSATRIYDLENRRQSYSLLHEIDEALKADGEPQVSPEQIDYEINRRASSLRSMGLNRHVSRNQSLNNRYLPTPQSRSRHYKSSGSLTRQLSKPTVANSRRPVVIRPSQTQSKQTYSCIEKLQKKDSEQTFNGRSRQSLVNADKPQQYDMSDDGDGQTSEPVYESISNYINNSARRNHFCDKYHNAYIHGYNEDKANTEISFESEQRSYDREDLARRMGDIKDNLEILKSSISQRRNNTTKRKTDRYSQARGRNKGQGQIRYATQAMWRESAMEPTNSEDETEISEKVLVVNMETDVYHGTQGDRKYSTYNKNSNRHTNYDYNEMFPSEMHYRNLNHFEKIEKNYSQNSCSFGVKPKYFYPTSINSHLDRENSESTQCFSNQGPRNLKGTLIFDKEEQGNQEFETGGIHDFEDKNSSSKYFDENMLAHSDGTAGNIEEHTNAELRAAYTYKEEMQNNLNSQTDRESDMFQKSHVDTEKAGLFRPGESEYYGILATTVTSSPNTDHAPLMYPQQVNDSSNFALGKASQPSVNSRGTIDHDLFRERHYVNSNENNCLREYYISDLESYTVYDSQLPSDSQLPRGDSRNEYKNTETYAYACSSSNDLQRDGMHKQTKSVVLEDTPGTIISTPNSNDLSINNVEDSTLVAGINTSDAEIEF